MGTNDNVWASESHQGSCSSREKKKYTPPDQNGGKWTTLLGIYRFGADKKPMGIASENSF